MASTKTVSVASSDTVRPARVRCLGTGHLANKGRCVHCGRRNRAVKMRDLFPTHYVVKA